MYNFKGHLNVKSILDYYILLHQMKKQKFERELENDIKKLFKRKTKCIYIIIIYMDETISTIKEKVAAALERESIYIENDCCANFYNNDDDDDDQDEYNDEHINFDELKNDELVRHKRISYSIKLEEIFKRKQKSKTPQDFKCNECFEMWTCAWCYYGFCDDIMSPYKLEGKPKFWSINDLDPEYLKSLTEKQKIKMIKQCEKQLPIFKNFFLCKWCKNEYIDKNISKGRHPKKIGRRQNTF